MHFLSAKSVKSSEDNKELQQTQHHDQPDLVPGESLAEKQKMEVNRLESLCQSYSVQINSLKLEVSRRNDWFHALLIVAQYLLQVIIILLFIECTLLLLYLVVEYSRYARTFVLKRGG